MAEQTQGPTGVKDLGGLVNKDIAFSKVPENVVYDSKNFRITTDDGGTLAVRSNIKGNEEILANTQVYQTTCQNNGKIVFDLRSAAEYFFLEVLSTLRTTIAITNSAGVTNNVYFDYTCNADNFVIPGNGFYIGVNSELLGPAKYIFSLLNFLNSNSVAQQSNIVIDTINYSNYDNQTLGMGPNILEFSFTSDCNVTINFTSLINLTATDSNGKSYLGYFNDPYLENFILRDSSNGLSGLDPLSSLYPITQATGILTNYNQIFDKTYSAYAGLPFGAHPNEYKNQLYIFSEYNDFNNPLQWDPTQTYSNNTNPLNYFLPVQKTNAIVDSTTSTTIETSPITSYLKIQDKFIHTGPRPEYLRNTAITNYQAGYESTPIYNPANYDGTWYFDLSYYVGKMSSNISLKVKVYIHLHNQANGTHNPALVNISGVTTTGSTPLINQFPTIANPTYVPPDTYIGSCYSNFNQQLFGDNNVVTASHITNLHTLVYEETFTTGSQNRLKNSNNNVTFSITFPNNLAALGANVSPSISVFLEPVYSGVHTDWEYEFYLDKLDVRGKQLNTGQALNGLITTNNNVTTSGWVGVPYPQDLLIGWCTLRDDVYLFFTNGKEDPDDPTTWSNPSAYTPSTKNEIWKFSYDKSGNFKDSTQYPSIFNFTLVYSNPGLNFTIHRPIANPGMIEARYENDLIQKIYWTDNFNVPRQINVADPNVASFTLDQLNLQPILTMDIPLITEVIDGGDLLIGVYQVLYRLTSTNGAETRFGPASQLIPIIEAPEGAGSNLNTYYPVAAVGTDANKSITVEVYNVDTDYDTIEFVLVYYDQDNTPKTIDIMKKEFIPDTGYVKTTITGGEDPIPITINELTAFTTSIKRCKTLAAKKQTLFLGNIITGSAIVDWDARAYRFARNTSQTKIKDDLGNSYLLDYNSGAYTLSSQKDFAGNTINTYSPPIPVPATHDCIQDYDVQAPTDDSKYIYKPNSSVLGGAGPNVSYEFITASVELSAGEAKGTGEPGYGEAGPYVNYIANAQGFHYGPSTSPSFYFNGAAAGNNQSPYHYDMLVGYRRDEMYRFGIVFFDELDNPTYVNWIADIRMPHIYMPDTSQGSSTVNNSVPNYPGSGPTAGKKRTRIGVTPDDRYINGSQLPGATNVQFTSDIVTYPTGVDTTNKYNPIGKPLGIRFTIDFSKVPSIYKRAAIVRVPRKEEDKRILGQGIICPTYKQTGTAAPNHVFTCTPFKYNIYDPSNPSSHTFNEIWPHTWTINSPEFLFDSYPGFSGGDAIDFVSMVQSTSLPGTPGNASYTRAEDYTSNGSTWVMHNQLVKNENYFTGMVSRLYQTKETSTIPSAIKQYTYTANPYPLETAFPLPHTAGYGGQLPNRPHIAGYTVVPNGSSSGAIEVNHCSPRDVPSPYGGGISSGAGTRGRYSYGGKSLFLQLKDNVSYDWNYTDTYGGHDFLGLDGWGLSTSIDGFYEAQYLANYKRTPAAAYGGNNYFQRANNEYVPCNNLIDISNKSVPITFNLFGGDTRVTVMSNVRQFFDYTEATLFPKNDRVDLLHKIHLFAVETSIAVDYRRSKTSDKSTFFEHLCVPHRVKSMEIVDGFASVGSTNYWTNNPRLSNYEHFEVDKVFNHTDKSVYTYFPAPALTTTPDKFDCRIWKSEPKISGELSDSWAVYKPGAYKDVESAYGPINNLIIFRDKMYYFQDKGFGIAQVDEQKLLQAGTTSISDLVLGSSGILERYDYISTKTGTKHQFSMSVSDYSIVWFDSLARKMYRYKGEGLEPLSDIKGLNAFLYNRTAGNLQISDNPYIFKGVHSTYDFRHNEFYMTFVDESDDTPVHITLVYNDLLDGFIGEYTHYPKVYINDKVNIFSPKPTTVAPEIFFIHNYGQYGRFYNQTPDFSELSFVLNTSSIVEKVLHNLEIVSEAFTTNTILDSKDSYLYDAVAEVKYQDFFDSMRIFDNYQNTDWITLIPNKLDLSSRDNYARKHKTIWDIRVPSDRVLNVNQNIFDPLNLSPVRPRLTKRFKDKWFMVDLRYYNSNNNKLVVHSAKPKYSVNSR